MIRVLYFASLRDASGCESEDVELADAGATAAELYASLRQRHSLPFARERLRVAIDGSFADWATPLADGAEVAFIPPVSGG